MCAQIAKKIFNQRFGFFDKFKKIIEKKKLWRFLIQIVEFSEIHMEVLIVAYHRFMNQKK